MTFCSVTVFNKLFVFRTFGQTEPKQCAHYVSWNPEKGNKNDEIIWNTGSVRRVKASSPDDASLRVLLPLGEGVGQVEEAPSGQRGADPRRGGAQQWRRPSHQDPTWWQVSRHKQQVTWETGDEKSTHPRIPKEGKRYTLDYVVVVLHILKINSYTANREHF